MGFDFNPTVDRIRLVTSTGQNLRLNPETGTVATTDGVLNGAVGATISGAAYTNNVAGAATTVLYDLDPTTDQLYRQDPPNNGTLVSVGNLNLNISGNGGFDIDAKTGTALGLYTVKGKPTLFSVDLSTGAARPLAEYAANLAYSAIAIPAQPVVYVASAYSLRAVFFNDILIYDPTTSPGYRTTRRVTGLVGSDNLTDIDFRPATGQLYALAGRRLYTIDLGTFAATPVATLSIPLESPVNVGIDFNPVVDRLRIVSNTGQNLRVNPVDGVAIEDGRLNPST